MSRLPVLNSRAILSLLSRNQPLRSSCFSAHLVCSAGVGERRAERAILKAAPAFACRSRLLLGVPWIGGVTRFSQCVAGAVISPTVRAPSPVLGARGDRLASPARRPRTVQRLH